MQHDTIVELNLHTNYLLHGNLDYYKGVCVFCVYEQTDNEIA